MELKKRIMYDVLSENRIKSVIKTKLLGNKIYAFWSIGTTNDFAYQRAMQGEKEGTLVIAEKQERGRGRKGRLWDSQFGKGLWFSLILKPDLPSSYSGLIPYLAGVSVAQAVEKITELQPDLKWPNDLLLSGKKFCGMLSDVHFNDSNIAFIILGIGVNVNYNPHKWSEDIEKVATSLRIESNKRINRAELLAEILLALDQNYEKFKLNGIAEILGQWKKRCPAFKKNITVVQENKKLTGLFYDLDEEGRLVLKSENGELSKIVTGDIVI